MGPSARWAAPDVSALLFGPSSGRGRVSLSALPAAVSPCRGEAGCSSPWSSEEGLDTDWGPELHPRPSERGPLPSSVPLTTSWPTGAGLVKLVPVWDQRRRSWSECGLVWSSEEFLSSSWTAWPGTNNKNREGQGEERQSGNHNNITSRCLSHHSESDKNFPADTFTAHSRFWTIHFHSHQKHQKSTPPHIPTQLSVNAFRDRKNLDRNFFETNIYI